MSTLVDMVNMRFGSKASALSIRACELRQDDIIADVIRDGDLVEVTASGSSETWTSLNQAIHDGSSLVSSNMGSPTIVRLPPKLALLQPAPGVDHRSAKGGPSMSMPIEARYRQIQRFTGGVMGTVYKAQDMASTGIYREVVVKLLQTGATAERRERFLREAKIVAGLQHPNIITYIDMGQDRHGTHYIIMEAVNGPDLQHILDTLSFIDEESTLTIIKGVLSGLACTHALLGTQFNCFTSKKSTKTDARGAASKNSRSSRPQAREHSDHPQEWRELPRTKQHALRV